MVLFKILLYGDRLVDYLIVLFVQVIYKISTFFFNYFIRFFDESIL